MDQPPTRVFLLFCIALVTNVADGCDNNGTGSCSFASTLCGWSIEGSLQHNLTSGGYVQLTRGADSGNLTSREVCSTEGKTHCFRFAYKFDVNNKINLSVSVEDSLNQYAESFLSITSSSNGWNEGSFPITTNYSFRIMFKVNILPGQNTSNYSVGVDAIRYINAPGGASCTIQPSAASPTSVSTTQGLGANASTPLATTSSVQRATKTTYEHTNLPRSTSRSNGEVLPTDNTKAGTVTSPSGNTEDETSESPDESGIIVGAVIGGIIFIVIIVVLLLVLCRRKQRSTRKANNTQQNSNLHLPQPATPTQPMDHRAIIVGHDDWTSAPESAMPEYAVVNKSRKVKQQENPPQSLHKMGDQSAQQHAQSSERNEVTEQEMKNKGGYDNYSLARIRDPPTASSSVYQVPRGDTATFSQGQGEEYNVLDLKGDNVAMEDSCVHGDSEGAASAVYSHLNEGDEDTYNEVDRQKRPEVLSDEYSHIQ